MEDLNIKDRRWASIPFYFLGSEEALTIANDLACGGAYKDNQVLLFNLLMDDLKRSGVAFFRI